MPVDTNGAPPGAGTLSDALGPGLDPGSEVIAAGPPDLGGIFRLPRAAWAWARPWARRSRNIL